MMTDEAHIVVRLADHNDDYVLHSHRTASKHESEKYRGVPLARTGAIECSVVAIVGSTIFGSLDISFPSKSLAHISHVFVEPEAREIGIGDALMTFALHHIRSLGAERVESSAQPGDRSLKNLFERHGLVAQTIIVGKSLSGPSTEVRASQ